MPVTTLTSREFNQDTGRAKRAAANGPVFITDRGKPTHVLLSIEEYQRLTGKRLSIVDMLSMPLGVEEIEVEFPRSRELPRAADFDVYMLDTNVVSELRKVRSGKADPDVGAWARATSEA